ncbi:hypothetical protein [Thomasclavelia sp.]|uniref:hypothetical protein n=1 Tax=Thomasclavelia sp. TaxID=3025757 RepID=UPI0025E7C27D|nr:hypothetical protein [Thomasclavelia sp.]
MKTNITVLKNTVIYPRKGDFMITLNNDLSLQKLKNIFKTGFSNILGISMFFLFSGALYTLINSPVEMLFLYVIIMIVVFFVLFYLFLRGFNINNLVKLYAAGPKQMVISNDMITVVYDDKTYYFRKNDFITNEFKLKITNEYITIHISGIYFFCTNQLSDEQLTKLKEIHHNFINEDVIEVETKDLPFIMLSDNLLALLKMVNIPLSKLKYIMPITIIIMILDLMIFKTGIYCPCGLFIALIIVFEMSLIIGYKCDKNLNPANCCKLYLIDNKMYIKKNDKTVKIIPTDTIKKVIPVKNGYIIVSSFTTVTVSNENESLIEKILDAI